MFELFQPRTKLQKNRQLMRQTDVRMAKYSRRGLISKWLAYVVCVSLSEPLYRDHPQLVIVLTIGLIITGIARGYYLFRFEEIYPRGPNAWRQRYFLATLASGCWWGIIVAAFTLVLDLRDSALLIWLYTVVLYATSAHALAPYQRFLSAYQSVGLVLPALACLFTGEPVNLLYGGILLMFYWILNHQSELLADNYWDRVQAEVALAEHAEAVAEQARDSRLFDVLNREFLARLAYELEHARADSLPELAGHVERYRAIMERELPEMTRAFNVRRLLHRLLFEALPAAERRGLELDSALSPALPARLWGDPARVAELFRTALEAALASQDTGLLLVEVDYLRGPYQHGELQISFSRQDGERRRPDRERRLVEVNLQLLVARALAGITQGRLDWGGLLERDNKALRLILELPAAQNNPKLDYQRPELKGKRALVAHGNSRWLESKRLDLEVLGLKVETAQEPRRAISLLQAALDQGRPFDAVVYTLPPEEDIWWQFAIDLAARRDWRFLTQLVVASAAARELYETRLPEARPMFVQKPAGLLELEIAAGALVADDVARPEALLVRVGADADDALDALLREHYSVMRANDLAELRQLLKTRPVGAVLLNEGEAEVEHYADLLHGSTGDDPGRDVLPLLAVADPIRARELLLRGVDDVLSRDELIAQPSHLRYWFKF